MQFNAHVEIVDGKECWWADSPGASGAYVAADTWDELFTLARELAYEEFGATAFALVGPWEFSEQTAS